MKTHLLLALEIIVCSGVWLAAYRLLLERRVRFTWCRAALLALPLLSVAIPMLRIPVWPGEVIEVEGSVAQPVAVAPAAIVTEPVAEAAIPVETLCLAAYLLGVALIAGVMLRQLQRIRRLQRGAEVCRMEGCTVVKTRQQVASFSFLKRIYVWREVPEEEMPAIIAHERSHIRHRHSLERIAMETMKALLWWNPFVWIAARMLTEVEEYEADHDVLQGGFNRERYMHILFRQMFGYSPEIANSMRNSLTKKRFQMMTSHYSGRYALLRLAATLPAIAGLLCAFSFTTRAAEVRIVDSEEPAQPTTHAIYLLNGEEVPVERIRPIDPAHLTLTESYTEETMPAAYGDRGAQFLFSYTSDAPESRYTPIRIEGRLHFPDGSPAAGIAVCACNRFTQPFTEEGVAELGTRSDADGRFTVEGPAWGSLCFTGLGISGINSYNSDGAATMTVDEELPYPRTDERSAREARTDASAAANGQTQSEDDWTEDDTPFLITETMPTFRGGDLNTFRAWVQSQVTYPADAQKRGIEGRVVLQFIIERDGSVTTGRVLESPDESLSQEALRVVSSATGWSAGQQRGTPVRVLFTLPVDFRMTGERTEARSTDAVSEGKCEVRIAVYSEGKMLEGATITVVGTNQGTTTNAEGYARLYVAPESTVRIAYTGCQSVERKVSDSRVQFWGIPLKPDDQAGKTIVVTDSETAFGNGPEARSSSPAPTPNDPDVDVAEDDTPFLVAETMPTFRGGDLNTFRAWVQSQITYPADAQKRGIEGRVVLRFIVERDGSVSSCRILQSPDESLSQEALHVVRSATGWTGGRQQGIPVRVQLLIPVDFRMNRPAGGADKGPAPQSGTPTSATAPTASATPAADRGSLSAATPVSTAETPRFRRNNFSDFCQWLQMNIRYPQQALREKTYGRIIVLFTINRDGKIEKPRIMGDKCDPFIQEVFRVLRLAPGWEPAAPGEKNSEGFAFLINFMIRTDEGMLREPARPARPLAMDEIAVVGIAS